MALTGLALVACTSAAPAAPPTTAPAAAPTTAPAAKPTTAPAGAAATTAPAAAPTTAAAAAALTASDVGVTKDAILLGGTDPLSGPAAAYGTIAKASDAYFHYVNDNGGVNVDRSTTST